MFTVEVLRRLFAHLEWAESQVWRAALGSPAATRDIELQDRFHHIHLTQRVFLEVWAQRPVSKHLDLRFSSLPDVYVWARPYYDEVRAFLGTLADDRLSTPSPVPWAKLFTAQLGCEPEVTTLGDTLFQVASHSAYHRAQVNTRLRALGVEPPFVDYIAWLWRGRPVPTWADIAAPPRIAAAPNSINPE